MIAEVIQVDSKRPISMSERFFIELKRYNSTNFRTLYNAELEDTDPSVIKAFSSVITRFFIFCEKHPELTDVDRRILYYQLKIDMIARFFANYPDTNTDDLIAFQTELKYFVKGNGGDDNANAVEI